MIKSDYLFMIEYAYVFTKNSCNKVKRFRKIAWFIKHPEFNDLFVKYQTKGANEKELNLLSHFLSVTAEWKLEHKEKFSPLDYRFFKLAQKYFQKTTQNKQKLCKLNEKNKIVAIQT